LDGQMLMIEDYLNQLPEEEANERRRWLKKYVQAGRLMVGPAYMQPDWGLVSGEALVRNLLIGHKMAEELGGAMKVGWMLDNFGQIAQAPQIYQGFDIDGVFVWRGVAMDPEELTSEFWWEAPDGSNVLAIYLINSYRNGMVLSLTKEIARNRVITEAEALRQFATTPNVLLMNGYEQVPWPDDVLPIIDEVNRSVGDEMQCVQSTPPEYLAAVKSFEPSLPTLKGYLYSGRYMPILKGVFSSRSQLKLLNNECQREIERWAEPFATIAWTLGAQYPAARLETAWKNLLVNHTHDDVCGCSIDPIARDMEARFAEAYKIASEISEESLKEIAQVIDTSQVECLQPMVVFNPSPRARRDIISFSVAVPLNVGYFYIKDGAGNIVPYQLIRRRENQADLHLFVDELPALGYKTYYLVEGTETPGAHPLVTADPARKTLENEGLLVQINPDGTLDVTNKRTGQTFQNLGYFEDGGDAGDTYDYSYPERDEIITSLGREAKITLEQSGPLVARFRVEIALDLPESLTPDRQQRSEQRRAYPIVSYVELTSATNRVEIKTILNNSVKDHRLRVFFPSGFNVDHAYAEEPFDVARLPVESEPVQDLPQKVGSLMIAGRYTAPVNTYPFQNFVDYTDGEKGLAIISRRLTEYEILPGGIISLTLLRSVGWLARYDLKTRVGDVGPHIFTPEAQCLGEHVFSYAISPHSGDWQEERTHIQAAGHNLRFKAMQTSTHPGALPDTLSFLSLVDEDPYRTLRMTALKRAEAGDGVIFRFYNTLDGEVTSKIKYWWNRVSEANRTNLNEKDLEPLPTEPDMCSVEAHQKEIVTVKLKLTPKALVNEEYQGVTTKRLPPLPPGDRLPPVKLPPVITKDEVQVERDRVKQLEEALIGAKAEVFTLEDDIERTASKDAGLYAHLQKLKTDVASLTRQLNEARISALLNRQLFINQKIETELEGIGEAMAWSRTKKRAGEYLMHYYTNLAEKQNK